MIVIFDVKKKTWRLGKEMVWDSNKTDLCRWRSVGTKFFV